MAGAHLIEPFPADIDRNHFGHYLSGFTDGEGSFALGLCGRVPPRRDGKKIPTANFRICLRADDFPILQLIQSYLGCGSFSFAAASAVRHGTVQYTISAVIPHFQHYPLRAKKRRDFVVWQEGVRLIREVGSIPRGQSGPRGGNTVRWTPGRMARFCELKETLAAGRGFNATVAPPPPAPVLREPSLFDALED
jgi:hypothetical protein